jgi:hypothetical protein
MPDEKQAQHFVTLPLKKNLPLPFGSALYFCNRGPCRLGVPGNPGLRSYPLNLDRVMPVREDTGHLTLG